MSAREIAVRYGAEYAYDQRVVDRVLRAIAGDGLRAELDRFLDERDHDGRDLTCQVLAAVDGALALPALLAAAGRDLYDSPHDLLSFIDEVMEEHYSAARSVLRRMIREGTVQERRAALEVFPAIVASSDVDILSESIADDDPQIRRLTVEALPGDAVELIIGRLRDPDEDVRLVAIHRLFEMRRPEAVEPLIAIAADPSPRVRSKVAQTLGTLRAVAAQSTLERLLHDPEQLVRDRARAALGEIGGGSVVDVLLGEAVAPDARKRAQAAKVLARLADGDPRALDRLRALAEDPDADVRAAVLSGLATVGDRSGRWSSLVVALSTDPDKTVRHRVANTARHLMPDPSAVLAALAADPSGFVREAVR